MVLSVWVCVSLWRGDRERERDTVASMGLSIQTSQSLLTRRLPAGPETAPAPGFHTPICHILKLPDTHFTDTHTPENTHRYTHKYRDSIIQFIKACAHDTRRPGSVGHVAVTWLALCCYDSSYVSLSTCVTCEVWLSKAVPHWSISPSIQRGGAVRRYAKLL